MKKIRGTNIDLEKETTVSGLAVSGVQLKHWIETSYAIGTNPMPKLRDLGLNPRFVRGNPWTVLPGIPKAEKLARKLFAFASLDGNKAGYVTFSSEEDILKLWDDIKDTSHNDAFETMRIFFK